MNGVRGTTRPTICGDYSGATREALHAVHEHYPARVDGVVDEPARAREVDEQVGVVDVFNANAKVADAGRRVICGNGLRSNGDDVRYASIGQRPRRNSSVDSGRREGRKGAFPLEKSCQGKQCQ